MRERQPAYGDGLGLSADGIGDVNQARNKEGDGNPML